MKVKKLLALCMSVAVTATAATTVMPVMAETSAQTNSTVLFSDNFDGYSDYISYAIGSEPINQRYAYDTFRLNTGAAVRTDLSTYEKFMTAPANNDATKRIAFKSDTGVGSGKALNVLTQGFVSYSGILKPSKITKEAIENKEIKFSIDFRVDTMYRGEGFGIWLAQTNSGKTDISPRTKEGDGIDAVTTGDSDKAKQLMVLAPKSKDAAPTLYAFGNELGTLKKNVVYTYTLEMVPNGTTYSAAAKIAADGEVTEYKIPSANLPTVDEFAKNDYVMLSSLRHFYTTKSEQFGNKDTDSAGNKNYQNDLSVIVADNLMMTAETIDNSILFSDNFDGYSDYISYAVGSEPINQRYAYDTFRLNTGAAVRTDLSTYEKFMTAPANNDATKRIAFKSDTGVGSGKALNVLTQGFVSYSGILKPSKITKEAIENKEIKFSIDFRVDTMYRGEGFGIWLAQTNSGKTDISPRTKEGDGIDAVTTGDSDKAKQLMVLAPKSKDAAPTLYAFGNELGTLKKNVVYTYTLEMVPNGTTYSAAAKIAADGEVTEYKIPSANLPTVDEFAKNDYVMLSSLRHFYTTKSEQFGNKDTDSAGNKNYQNDLSVIVADNLMMRAVDPVNMEGASVNGYATMSGNDGSKTVTVKINPLSGKSITPYVIVAVYNPETGELKSARLWEGNGTSISTETTATVAEIAATSTDKVSVFMWNGFTDINPLTNSVIFN